MALADQFDCFASGDFSVGDNGWMLTAGTLVFLQSPALAIMQAGMVRKSGFLSMFLQVLAGMSLGGVLWLIYGYSLTFGPDHVGIIGDLDYAMLVNVDPNKCFRFAPTISTTTFVMFELTFAILTPVVVTGTWAERIHFPALFMFIFLWPLLCYYPIAHWIWGGGWLGRIGVADFAGGMVVHTLSGVAGFVVALMVGIPGTKDDDVPVEERNVGLTIIGGILIWAGWFGFNGGSFFNAGPVAGSALLNTHIAASAGALAWGLWATLWDAEYNWYLLEFLNGALAGMAGVTPSAGFDDTWAAFCIGIICSTCAFLTQRFLKGKVYLSDSLDVTSLQAAPGITGSLCAGLFSRYVYTGAFYGNPIQLAYQLLGIMTTIFWCSLWTWVILKIIWYTVGFFPKENPSKGQIVA